MYVVPAARRQGLGWRLLEELEAAARELGYARIRLDTGPRQPHAQAMYERAGYHPIDEYNSQLAGLLLGGEDPAVTAFVLTLVGAALAVGLELLEAMAIVLAVGSARRPRDAVIGAVGRGAAARGGGRRGRPAAARAAAVGAAAGRDRRGAAAVRARVAAQGRAAAGRAALAVGLVPGVPRGARGARGAWPLPARPAGLAGADRGRQGRAARGRRGRADRGRARRGPGRAGAGGGGRRGRSGRRGGGRRGPAPAADAAAGVAPQVRGRRGALVVRRRLPRRGARRRWPGGDAALLYVAATLVLVSQAQVAALAREPVAA